MIYDRKNQVLDIFCSPLTKKDLVSRPLVHKNERQRSRYLARICNP